MTTVTWAQIKSLVNSKNLSIQYVDFGDFYDLRIFDGSSEILCNLIKDGGADQTDFETNYKPTGNKIITPNNFSKTHTFTGTPLATYDIDVTGFASVTLQTNSYSTNLFFQGSVDGVLFNDLNGIKVADNVVTGAIYQNGLFMVNVTGLKTFRLSDVTGGTTSVVLIAFLSTPFATIINPIIANIRDIAGFDITSTNYGVSQGLDINILNTSIPITGTVIATNSANGLTGAVTPLDATLIGGTDGTDLRAIKVSSSGVVSVDGSAVTQPISATSLPTHGVTQSGTWTVQPGNTANTTAWKVDGSGVTQPVSGTFWQATQPISGTVTANAGTNLNTSALALESGGNLASIKTNTDNLNLAQGSTTSGQHGNLTQGAVTTNAPGYSTGQTSPISLDTSGLLRVSLKDTPANTNKFLVTADAITFASPQHVIADSGTITTVSTVTNLSQLGGTAVSMNTGTRDAGTQRVTIATNDIVPVSQSGTWSLAANQSVNNAEVNGAAVVTSVTGVQDVMPRKRTSTTGLSPNYSASHITTKTTTTPTSSTAYVSAIVISCSGAGTSWTMVIQNKEGTPKILVPSFTLTVPTTGLPVILQFAEPILMTSGIDIVTAGTTAGTVDVFITYWQ